jgi:hypothetical protein
MRANLRMTVVAVTFLGASAFSPTPLMALDDDVDKEVDVEIDRDRPGLLPGEPLKGSDADVEVDTPDDDVDIETDDDDADVEVKTDDD